MKTFLSFLLMFPVCMDFPSSPTPPLWADDVILSNRYIPRDQTKLQDALTGNLATVSSGNSVRKDANWTIPNGQTAVAVALPIATDSTPSAQSPLIGRSWTRGIDTSCIGLGWIGLLLPVRPSWNFRLAKWMPSRDGKSLLVSLLFQFFLSKEYRNMRYGCGDCYYHFFLLLLLLLLLLVCLERWKVEKSRVHLSISIFLSLFLFVSSSIRFGNKFSGGKWPTIRPSIIRASASFYLFSFLFGFFLFFLS